MATDKNGKIILSTECKTAFRRAQHVERYVARLIEFLYKVKLVEITEGKFSEYDIKFVYPDGGILTVEVKEDLKCAKSGNVVLEIGHVDKPSGLMVTKADIYVYIIHRKDGSWGTYLQSTDGMRMLRKSYDDITTEYMGDGKDEGEGVFCCLYKYDRFVRDLALIDDSSYYFDNPERAIRMRPCRQLKRLVHQHTT